MAVTGPGSAGSPVSGNPAVRPVSPTPPNQVAGASSKVDSGAKPLQSPQDELDISSAGRMMNEAATPTGEAGESTPSEMRAERLARIKAAIDDGTYDTDERLDAALSRMIDRVAGDMD